MNMINKHRTGIGYFFYGLELALTPGIRRFVIIPLLINLILVGSSLYYLFSHLTNWIDLLLQQFLPSFFSWLSYLLWPLAALTILFVFSYFFSTLANFIAAPFNGLLAEKIEEKLIGDKISDAGLLDLIKDTPRILNRELRKFVYFAPKMLGLFILLWIPALGQTIGTVLWFIFTAWILAIQYCDYPFDNHKVSFIQMRDALKAKQSKVYAFGAIVSFFTSIPIVNLFVMPVAICGATAMWVVEFKTEFQH